MIDRLDALFEALGAGECSLSVVADAYYDLGHELTEGVRWLAKEGRMPRPLGGRRFHWGWRPESDRRKRPSQVIPFFAMPYDDGAPREMFVTLRSAIEAAADSACRNWLSLSEAVQLELQHMARVIVRPPNARRNTSDEDRHRYADDPEGWPAGYFDGGIWRNHSDRRTFEFDSGAIVEINHGGHMFSAEGTRVRLADGRELHFPYRVLTSIGSSRWLWPVDGESTEVRQNTRWTEFILPGELP